MKGKLNRKGQISLQNTPEIVLLFVIIGIFLTVGALILAEVQDKQKDTANSREIVNESHTVAAPVQGNNFTLDEVRVDFSGTLTTVLVSNTTTDTVVDNANFTFGATTGILTIVNSSNYGTLFNVTYSFSETTQDVFFNSTTDSLEAIGTISSFTPIIAVVVSAAIILGIVFLMRS